jgi:hypothetical protein
VKSSAAAEQNGNDGDLRGNGQSAPASESGTPADLAELKLEDKGIMCTTQESSLLDQQPKQKNNKPAAVNVFKERGKYFFH